MQRQNMEVSLLNSMVKQFKIIKLNEFSENGISTTVLKDGSEIYATLTEKTVMFFKKVETLGDNAEDHPNVFSAILTAGMSGGMFMNLRTAYDPETTILWVCYAVATAGLTAGNLETAAEHFIENADNYSNFLKSVITEAYLGENTTPEGRATEGTPVGNRLNNIQNLLSI